MARAISQLHRYVDPRSHDRVREHSAQHVNDQIDRATETAIADTVARGREAIEARIEALDQEWDVDRAVMANFAVVGSATLLLGRRDRRWLYLFGAQQLFLLMHALAGWCPPVPLFRRLGFRTAKEISAERQALVKKLVRPPPKR
jgi:hypothetical protein